MARAAGPVKTLRKTYENEIAFDGRGADRSQFVRPRRSSLRLCLRPAASGAGFCGACTLCSGSAASVLFGASGSRACLSGSGLCCTGIRCASVSRLRVGAGLLGLRSLWTGLGAERLAFPRRLASLVKYLATTRKGTEAGGRMRVRSPNFLVQSTVQKEKGRRNVGLFEFLSLALD